MARRRNRKKKQTDETLVDLIEVRDSAQGFIDRNQKWIFGALTLVVVAIGGLFAYNNFNKKPRQAEAVQQMAQAQYHFERDSFAQALTNPGGGHPGFVKIAEDYSGTAAGNLALYYTGISYLNLGEYAAALDYLNDYNPSGDITPIMKYGAMGDAFSELNEFDKAMKYYKIAIKKGENDFLIPYYLKKIGLLHERNGNPEDARAVYQRIKDEYPESTEGREIDKYIVRVE